MQPYFLSTLMYAYAYITFHCSEVHMGMLLLIAFICIALFSTLKQTHCAFTQQIYAHEHHKCLVLMSYQLHRLASGWCARTCPQTPHTEYWPLSISKSDLNGGDRLGGVDISLGGWCSSWTCCWCTRTHRHRRCWADNQYNSPSVCSGKQRQCVNPRQKDFLRSSLS